MMNMEHTPLPWKAVPGNENHGPYITDAFETTVCDLYVMSPRMIGESKPVLFADAELNLPLIVEAVNSHASLVEENKRLREALEPFAREADQWEGFEDDECLVEGWNGGPTSSATVGNLRSARAALGDTNA